jgi:hypothetical protein
LLVQQALAGDEPLLEKTESGHFVVSQIAVFFEE